MHYLRCNTDNSQCVCGSFKICPHRKILHLLTAGLTRYKRKLVGMSEKKSRSVFTGCLSRRASMSNKPHHGRGYHHVTTQRIDQNNGVDAAVLTCISSAREALLSMAITCSWEAAVCSRRRLVVCHRQSDMITLLRWTFCTPCATDRSQGMHCLQQYRLSRLRQYT